MQSTYLPIAVKSAAIGIADALPAFINGSVSHEHALYITSMYRRMATGFLLLTGVPDAFFEHLRRSGRCYLHFLSKSSSEVKATGKAAPFFDAVACDDMEGAAAIAQHSRADWNPLKEYEDDFLYMYFLMRRFFLGAGEEELQRTVIRYEEVLEGACDYRLDLCRSFLERSQEAFDASVEALIEDTRGRQDDLRNRGMLNPDEAVTTAHICVELLAWLRLAQDAGLATAESYPMAPDVARLLRRARRPEPGSWKSIEGYTDILP